MYQKKVLIDWCKATFKIKPHQQCERLKKNIVRMRVLGGEVFQRDLGGGGGGFFQSLWRIYAPGLLRDKLPLVTLSEG